MLIILQWFIKKQRHLLKPLTSDCAQTLKDRPGPCSESLMSGAPVAHGLLDLSVQLRDDPVAVCVDTGAQQCVSLLQQTRHVFICALVYTLALSLLLLLQPDHSQYINQSGWINTAEHILTLYNQIKWDTELLKHLMTFWLQILIIQLHDSGENVCVLFFYCNYGLKFDLKKLNVLKGMHNSDQNFVIINKCD